MSSLDNSRPMTAYMQHPIKVKNRKMVNYKDRLRNSASLIEKQRRMNHSISSISVKRFDKPKLPLGDRLATNLASIYGEAVFFSSKNLDIHQKSSSLIEKKRLLRTKSKRSESESPERTKIDAKADKRLEAREAYQLEPGFQTII